MPFASALEIMARNGVRQGFKNLNLFLEKMAPKLFASKHMERTLRHAPPFWAGLPPFAEPSFTCVFPCGGSARGKPPRPPRDPPRLPLAPPPLPPWLVLSCILALFARFYGLENHSALILDPPKKTCCRPAPGNRSTESIPSLSLLPVFWKKKQGIRNPDRLSSQREFERDQPQANAQ